MPGQAALRIATGENGAAAEGSRAAWHLRLAAGWHRRIAGGWLALGRPRPAAARLQRACALCPDDARLRAALAHALALCGQRAEAIACLTLALSFNSDDAIGWFNLGFLWQEEGAHAAALECFERALALDERLDRAHYGKALSLLRTGRVAEAIGPLLRNTELQPMSPYGWYQLGHAHARLGDREALVRVVERLAEFEPAVARLLARETGLKLVPAEPGWNGGGH